MHCLCTPTLRAGRAFSLQGVRHVTSAARPAAPQPQQPRGPRPALYCPPPASALAVPYLPPEAMADPRFLRVAIVGEPNAGKSTLLNAFLGAPLSAVSRKCNTTRDRVLGVSTADAFAQALADVCADVPPRERGSAVGAARAPGRGAVEWDAAGAGFAIAPLLGWGEREAVAVQAWPTDAAPDALVAGGVAYTRRLE